MENGGSPRDPETARDLELGRDLLERGEVHAAVKLLSRAFQPKTGDYEVMSWYGLALAKAGVDRLRGVVLCEAALRKAGQYPSPDLFHNLGRAYLAAQYRSQAADVLRRGASFTPDHEGINRTLREMGIRRRPVLPFLARKNPLNKYLGLLRSRLFPARRQEAPER